jgi:ribosomal protein S27AE
MSAGRLRYLEHFLDCVDFVSSGRKGAVSEDKFLVTAYVPEYYTILQKHLKNTDPRVRSEVVILLTTLRERQAVDDIKKLRVEDNDRVSSACLAYLASVDEDDNYIPELLDVLEHRNGSEFFRAASKMASIGRKEDIPELRKIHGQVNGEMHNAIGKALVSIVDRNADLKPKKSLIMSAPIFPDEKSFLKFADNSSVYLDIRYRDNIFPKTEISATTYNNVADAIKKIQIRLFNESDNLRWYSPEATARYDELADLLLCVADDLKTKKVIDNGFRMETHDCKSCGSRMAKSRDTWVCPECGCKESY